jgi:hypothetical protein
MTDDAAPLKTSSFGACTFEKTSPAKLEASTPAINIVVTFEEALKLNLAIDECVRKLGRYNRATSSGRAAALLLVIHLDKCRIRVQEGKVS